MEFDRKKLAYCGIYCQQCSFLAAYETMDKKHLLHTPARYEEIARQDIAELACPGCQDAGLRGECAIKDCATARNIDCCAGCADFPCAIILDFAHDGAPHHRWAFENLQTIQAEGIENWFNGFKASLYCQCGERLSWYYKCPLHPAG
jgi:hypothetical protein